MASEPDRRRAVMRFALAALYVAAGFAHLAVPDKFLAIAPSWVPFPIEVILVTGICEIAGSIALLMTPLRWWAGVALALYALCVWPANIKHALEGIDVPPIPNSWLYHGPRLVLQPVLIWWALYCADVIAWPWRRQRG
ncbi:DoxX family protein [Bradyrhizobium centrosematis]|uniref:DoxX family protein n=1 Tax=Bradyrhizobium centrosematis TaxID=1300039 RepID=UPI00216A0387|nr:DoxX family protein [Bradyrhizobium centrosematis]MCS3762801.1 putative membrane protein [Bradyrhizobium centrosematis]MCS3775470.1 putative membrane protein [Bradyrhizobium centrosematis]